MPQHSLLNSADDPIGLRIEWVDRTPDLVDGFDLTISHRRRDGDWTTYLVQRWNGYMLDLAEDATRSIAHAWLFGDSRDVLRAAVAVHRQAKKHHATHSAG